MTDWSKCIAQVAPQIVRIQTADRSGTGFIHYGTDGGTRFIATARHVIEALPEDQKPFFVVHGATVFRYGMPGSKDALVIRLNEGPDSDAYVFAVINKRLPKPSIHLVSPSERAQITEGVEVGWLGFPSLDHLDPELSFFSGRVSRIDPLNNRYLIDGTNVPGCSGGPVFLPTPNGPRIIGTLTDYFPHTVADRPERPFLPGLSAAVDVSEFQAIEGITAKLRPAERRLTISLDKCPRCKGPIVEAGAGALPPLYCKAGCGNVIRLLDRDFVDGFPGGATRLAALLHQERKRAGLSPHN